MNEIVKREVTTSVKVPDAELTEKILRMEQYIIDNFDPVEIEWIHRFTPGVYSREMVVEPDTLITGVIHKTEHLSIFLEGAMVVPNIHGGEPLLIEAPFVEIAQPGIKRAGIAIERCRWITVHATDEQDIETLEDMLFTNDPKDVPVYWEAVGHEKRQVDVGLGQRDSILTRDKKELLE